MSVQTEMTMLDGITRHTHSEIPTADEILGIQVTMIVKDKDGTTGRIMYWSTEDHLKRLVLSAPQDHQTRIARTHQN